MGKVEKVIVLSVLFLVALILVVTVTVDDPLDKAKVVEAGGRPVNPALAQQPTPPPPSAQPLLTTTIAPNQPVSPAPQPAARAPVEPPASQPQVLLGAGGTQQADGTPPASGTQPAGGAAAPVAALPPGALLKQVDGLQDSWFADLKLYTWKEGDTWRGVSQKYYGDWQRLDVLKRHNEGRMDVEPGEIVFIPVFANERDPSAEAARLAAAEGTTSTQAGDASSATKSAAAPTGGVPGSGKKLHVVASGESLWKIAKAELGDGNRWKEIYDANRDVLDKPESIRKGMRLRIP